MVMIHGAGENSSLWARVLTGLSGSASAFAIDLPGHPRGDVTCHSVQDYSEAAHEFIAEKGLSNPSVCGHSMGGAVALMLSLKHPEQVGSLILVDTGARLGVQNDILEGLATQPLKSIEDKIIPMSFHSEVVEEARASFSLSNLAVFLNDYRACNVFDLRAEVSKIGVPVLILCGDRDAMTPPKWSHFLASRIINSRLYFLSETGHMAPLERPGLVSGLMQSFLIGLNR